VTKRGALVGCLLVAMLPAAAGCRAAGDPTDIALPIRADGAPPGGAPAAPVPTAPTAAAAAPHWPKPLDRPLGSARPTAVLIPRIGVSASLMAVGQNKDGTIGAPPLGKTNLAGWYRSDLTPGQPGPAVIIGHLDTRTGPAVFARLERLRRGDAVGVVRTDGTVAVFGVQRTQRTAKDEFPVGEVFAAGRAPTLRLVTCGGRFDVDRHAYEDNVIVYATFAAAYLATDFPSSKKP
jgi:hypothetical protein